MCKKVLPKWRSKMLFVKSAIEDYYYMVGGGVHMGETSLWWYAKTF